MPLEVVAFDLDFDLVWLLGRGLFCSSIVSSKSAILLIEASSSLTRFERLGVDGPAAVVSSGLNSVTEELNGLMCAVSLVVPGELALFMT